MSVVILHGDEYYQVAREASRISREWRSHLVSDFGLDELDAGRIGPAELQAAVQQVAFLDPYRVIELRALAPARADHLAPALASITETSKLLISITGKLPASSKLLKAAKATPDSTVTEFPKLKGAAIADWGHRRGRELGLPGPVVAQVLKVSPDDLAIIDSEMEKLAAYSRTGAALTPEVLAELLAGGREQDVFKLTDMILPQPQAEAWRIVRGLIREGNAPTSIAFRLARHISLVLEVKAKQGRGLSLTDIQSEVKAHPFVVKKACEAARRVSEEDLERGLKALLRYEWELKSGQVDAERGLEVALSRI